MNTPTPTNDEWIVTDNMNYIEIASTKTLDSIASVHGGKTVGEQYDLAGRIAKVPQLERELTAVTEQRDGLRAGIDYASEQLTKVKEQRDEWKSKYIQQNKDLGCEQMDPDGTIWDHAKKIQSDLATVTKQRDGIEAKLRIELRGHPDSELWGEAGLIAATMRCVDAHDEATEQRDRLAEALKEIYNVSAFDYDSMPEIARRKYREVVTEMADAALQSLNQPTETKTK